MASSLKQDVVRQAIHKLERTTSYNKKANLDPLENQLYSKGTYVLPKVLEMGQVGSDHKIFEMGSQQASSQDILSPTLNNRAGGLNKIRNF